jgi:hypothetical protein
VLKPNGDYNCNLCSVWATEGHCASDKRREVFPGSFHWLNELQVAQEDGGEHRLQQTFGSNGKTTVSTATCARSCGGAIGWWCTLDRTLSVEDADARGRRITRGRTNGFTIVGSSHDLSCQVRITIIRFIFKVHFT